LLQSDLHLFEILLIILPVFLLLAVGFGVVKTGYLPPDISGPLNSFAVKLAVPALLFKAIYNLDFEAAFNVEMLGVFFGAAFVCFLKIGRASCRERV